MYNVNTVLNERYSLNDLIQTSQNLSQPNIPTSSTHFENLGRLADVLIDLEALIGPFKIHSAYRTKELQNALSQAGEPTSQSVSFHELGRAVDIEPLNMELAQAFGTILASSMKNQFAEIAFKPSQGSLHLAINTPDDFRWPKVLGLDDAKKYGKLTEEEVETYASSSGYVPTAIAWVTNNKIKSGGILFGLIGLISLALFVVKKK